MKLATFRRRGAVSFGAVADGLITDLGHFAPDLTAFLAGDLAACTSYRDAPRFAVSEVEQWLPPIPRPGKIVCVGLNYRSHLALLADPTPVVPVLFMKPTTSLVGSGAPIVIPPVSGQVDYEGELAVVIGKQGKYVSESAALSHVGGYCCANDVSAHDIEFQTSQWTSGKMLDTFCPMGPVLVTANEVPVPNALRLRTILNGETVQDQSTSDMVFSVARLISYISSLSTLEPGDVILTGTPAGLGCMRNPQLFLQSGDRISVEIEGIGRLDNPVIAAGL